MLLSQTDTPVSDLASQASGLRMLFSEENILTFENHSLGLSDRKLSKVRPASPPRLLCRSKDDYIADLRVNDVIVRLHKNWEGKWTDRFGTTYDLPRR